MNRSDAELQARAEAWEDAADKYKKEVLDDPVELYQALASSGITVTEKEKKLYKLLGVLTNQGFSIDHAYMTIHSPVVPQILDTVKELSIYIERAVEDYVQDDRENHKEEV